MKSIKVLFLSLLLISSLIVIGSGSTLAQDNVSLKVGIMPAVDSAPILLAEKSFRY